MASSNIKLFDENKGNMLSDSEFSISNQRMNGLQTGVASSQLQNKAMYQVSLVAYAIAQIMMQNGLNANDTDAVSAFVANLSGTMLQKVYDVATTEEAQAGVSTGKWMSPALVKAAIDALAAKAQNILSDETKLLFGLGTDGVPDDVFSIIGESYWFHKYIEVIYESGTWTVPDTFIGKKLIVFAVGGGGGGGESGHYGVGAGGGGYVEYAKIEVNPGDTFEVIVGAGGTKGNSGGTTSFGDVVSAEGGGSTTSQSGGSGGSGGGGTALENGGNGGTGYQFGGGGTGYVASYTQTPGKGGRYGGKGGTGAAGAKPEEGPLVENTGFFLPTFPVLATVGYGGKNIKGGGGGGGYGANGGDGSDSTTANTNGGGGGGGFGGAGGNAAGYYAGGGGGFFAKGGDGFSVGQVPGGGGGGGYRDGGASGGNGAVVLVYRRSDA